MSRITKLSLGDNQCLFIYRCQRRRDEKLVFSLIAFIGPTIDQYSMWEKQVKSGPGGGGNWPKASAAPFVKIILDLSKYQKGSSKPLCGSVRRVYARAREAFTQ